MPSSAVTTSTAYVLNDSQADIKYYTYSLNQGDSRYIYNCYPAGYPNNNGPVTVYLGPTVSAGSFQVGYSAVDTAESGQTSVYCTWQNPSDGYPQTKTIPLTDYIGAGVTVYDATPSISYAGTSAGTPVAPYNGDQEGILLTITGSNFGSSNSRSARRARRAAPAALPAMARFRTLSPLGGGAKVL